MKKNLNSTLDTYLSQPCERCGAKKRIARTWKEEMPTFSGTTTVEYSQVVCTDIVCQTTFDKRQADEAKKKDIATKQKAAQQDKNKKAAAKAKKIAKKAKNPTKKASKKK